MSFITIPSFSSALASSSSNGRPLRSKGAQKNSKNSQDSLSSSSSPIALQPKDLDKLVEHINGPLAQMQQQQERKLNETVTSALNQALSQGVRDDVQRSMESSTLLKSIQERMQFLENHCKDLEHKMSESMTGERAFKRLEQLKKLNKIKRNRSKSPAVTKVAKKAKKHSSKEAKRKSKKQESEEDDTESEDDDDSQDESEAESHGSDKSHASASSASSDSSHASHKSKSSSSSKSPRVHIVSNSIYHYSAAPPAGAEEGKDTTQIYKQFHAVTSLFEPNQPLYNRQNEWIPLAALPKTGDVCLKGFWPHMVQSKRNKLLPLPITDENEKLPGLLRKIVKVGSKSVSYIRFNGDNSHLPSGNHSVNGVSANDSSQSSQSPLSALESFVEAGSHLIMSSEKEIIADIRAFHDNDVEMKIQDLPASVRERDNKRRHK